MGLSDHNLVSTGRNQRRIRHGTTCRPRPQLQTMGGAAVARQRRSSTSNVRTMSRWKPSPTFWFRSSTG